MILTVSNLVSLIIPNFAMRSELESSQILSEQSPKTVQSKIELYNNRFGSAPRSLANQVLLSSLQMNSVDSDRLFQQRFKKTTCYFRVCSDRVLFTNR